MTKNQMSELGGRLGVLVSRRATIEYVKALLDKLNITVPEGATKKQLEDLLDEHFRTPAVITTDKGLDFRQTDKPTQVYIVDFTIRGTLSIRADSEESATEWVKNKLDGLNYSSCAFTIEDSYTRVDYVFASEGEGNNPEDDDLITLPHIARVLTIDEPTPATSGDGPEDKVD